MSEDKKEELRELAHNFVDEMNQISYDISEFITKTQKKYKMNADKSYIFFEFLRKYGEFSTTHVAKKMKNTRSDMDEIIDKMFEASEFQVTQEEYKEEE